MNVDMIKIRRKLKRNLDENRFEHTMGVMYTAAAMAMAHDVDVDMAMTAGLLHDCAKCIDNTKKIELCKKYNIEINDSEIANPGLLHAKLGAELAKRKYGIEDESILSAIASHTTGKPDMSDLDKIIYIADYIEPNRKPLPNFPVVRKLAYEDLDNCLYVILKDSLKYLASKNFTIDPMTEQTFNFYNDELGRN